MEVEETKPVVDNETIAAAPVEDGGEIETLEDLFEATGAMPKSESKEPDEDVLGIDDEGEDEAEAAKPSDDTEGKVDAPTEDRVQELLTKYEKEELSDEEMAELAAAGYVEQDDSATTSTEAKEGEEEKLKEEPFKAPAYTQRLQQMFPTGKFEDAVAVEEGVSAALDELGNYYEQDKALTEAIEKNPEVGVFLKAVVNGSSIISALVEAGLDPNDTVPKAGEDGYDEYVIAAHNKKQMASQRETNWNKSTQDVKSFFEKEVPDMGMRAKIGEELTKHFQDIAAGRVSPEFMKLVYDGLTKGTAVAEATDKAFKEGANKKIVLKKKVLVRKGDGMKRPSIQDNSIIKQQKVQYANDGSKALYDMFGEE